MTPQDRERVDAIVARAQAADLGYDHVDPREVLWLCEQLREAERRAENAEAAEGTHQQAAAHAIAEQVKAATRAERYMAVVETAKLADEWAEGLKDPEQAVIASVLLKDWAPKLRAALAEAGE